MRIKIFLVSFVSFISYVKLFSQGVITGRIKGKHTEYVSLLKPINGFSNETIYEEAIVSKVSNDGFFKLRTDFTDAYFSKITIDNEPFWIVLGPKDSIDIEVDFSEKAADFYDALKVKGTNAKGIWLLNKINYIPFNKFIPIHDLISDKRKFSKDSLFAKCSQIIKTQVSPFDTLYDKGEISKPFFEIVKYSLKGILLQEFIHKLFQSKYYKNIITIDQALNYFNREIQLRNYIYNPILKKCYFNEILYQKYFELTSLKSAGLNYYRPMKDSLLFLKKQPYKISSDFVSWIKNIPPDIKENIWGKALYGTANLFPTFLNKDDLKYFETTFPQSNFLKLIKNSLGQELLSQDLAQASIEIKIKDSTGSTYKNIQQLLKEYRDTILYIDVWATWCAPCKYEFRNEKSLDTILKPYTIKRIYISIDDSMFFQEWKKNIFSFHLKGDHLIAGTELQEDLKNIIYSMDEPFSVPRYIIVNKEGYIINKNAPRPGEPGALKFIFDKL